MSELAGVPAALSPERQKRLTDIVTIQERMIGGVIQIFSGMRASSDPEVVEVSAEALDAIEKARDVMNSMIDSLNSTKH
jgi:hypothetical protein